MPNPQDHTAPKMSKDPSTPKPLDDILGRVRHIGPVPRPTEDQVMDMVVDVISTARAERASPQTIEALDDAEAKFREGKMHRLAEVLAKLDPKPKPLPERKPYVPSLAAQRRKKRRWP